MTAHLTVISGSNLVLQLVSEYAHGLGCASEPVAAPHGPAIRVEVPDADQRLVELLSHVALGCIKAGFDVTEPLCEVTYHHTGAASQVRLSLRMQAFTIESVTSGTGA